MQYEHYKSYYTYYKPYYTYFLVYYNCIIARSALYVPLPKNVPWTDSVLLLLLLLQIIITFCGRQMGCVTALLPFGSLKEIF